MEDTKKLIRHLRKLFLALVLGDIIVAAALWHLSGTPFGWIDFSLNETSEITIGRILAVLQFVLIAGTFDVLIRRACLIHNLTSSSSRIPNLMILLFSVASYGFFGLAGFVLLYDYSIKALIAGSSAIGLGVAFMAKDFIHEAIASVQIQYDRLFTIGDWISMGDKEAYCVVDIERRLVTLRTHEGDTVKFPSTKFLSGGIRNLSRAETGCSRTIFFQIDPKYRHEKILAIMDLAAKYVVKNNPVFYNRFSSSVNGFAVGSITYRIKYFCQPSAAPNNTNMTMYMAVLKFLNAASICLESSIAVSQLNDTVDQTRRLLDIRNHSVLKVLSLEEIQTLAGKVALCEFRAGETILRHGDSGDSMFFIFEGSLDIQIPKENGEKSSVATLWPGDCVGEMSMLTGEPRSADVIAINDVLLLQVTKAELQPILTNNPGLVDKLSRMLAERKVANQKHLSGADAEAETAQETQTIAKRIIGFFALGLKADI